MVSIISIHPVAQANKKFRKKYGSKRILILYGGFKERHEAAVCATGAVKTLEGSGVAVEQRDNLVLLNWEVTPARKIVQIGSDLFIYLLCWCFLTLAK